MSEEEEISHEDVNQNEDLIKNNNKENKNNKNVKISDSSNINEEDSEANDIMPKINKETKKIKSNINSKNMKVFEKYHNLSIKELHILLSQKNDDLIKLNEEKEKSKKILSDLINKLNNAISLNSDFLCNEEEDADLLLNLEKTKEDKKKQLENSKKINNLFKEQLSNIKNKISNNEKMKKKLSLIDTKLDNLKKKNILLKKEINEIKSKKVLQDKELEIISDNKKYPLKIKIKTEEMNNFASQKHDYFAKLSMSMKSLDNIFKEIKRFDEMYNSSIKEDTDENVVKKINFWINLIKNDLTGDKNEILSRIENDKSQFLNEIKNRNDININSNYNTIGNETMSFNSHTEESPPKINDIENDTFKNNDKILKNKIIINKNKSSSLLYSNFNKNAYNMKKNKKPSLTNSENNLEHKTLFKKLNYLKMKTPGNGMKLKLRNINNLDNDMKSNNYFISEEINESIEINNTNSKPKQTINNQELNTILSRDYNQISDADYRELLNKKEQYLESNLRLEKNIVEIKKTKKIKLYNILKVIKENEINLENIKKQNILIEKEINNLVNVFQLTVEQVKLKNEIHHSNNKKKLKLKIESVKNEENKLVKSIDKISKNQNLEEIIIPKKKQIKSIENNNSNKKKNKIETREEQLKLIREKYKDGNIEINEDNDNQIKEKENDYNNEKNNEELNENQDNKNDIINYEKINKNNEEINNEEEKELIS